MRRTVEAVGPAWRCSSGGPWSWEAGHEFGSANVGRRRVAWVRRGDAVTVTHDGVVALFAALLGATPAEQVYAVELVLIGSGSGQRAAWRCPSCGRAAGLLYLPPDRHRLACRRCCGLLYNSQFESRRKRRSG